MIQKTLIQGALLILLFLGIWFGLSQIDFEKLFNVERNTANTEQKLGELLWDAIRKTETIITNDSVTKPVNKLVKKLTAESNISYSKIKVHVIQKDEINAFAMPGNHLIVYTGLIADCENESELAGVLGHEIAHLEKNHVMKKLVKEVGLSVLISMATGGRNSQTAQQTIKLLSASAYDRSLESEADIAAVDYMESAGFDPQQFANFMFKMGSNTDVPSAFYWISTHPESEERAKAIIDYIGDTKHPIKKLLSDKEWRSLKDLSR